MSVENQGFLEWKEVFVSQEKGNRLVHCYLKDSAGDSILAVIGTERSVRHMVYVAEDDFLKVYGADLSITCGFKWRSRREVVDWLTSLLSKPPRDRINSPTHDSAEALGSSSLPKEVAHALGSHIPDDADHFSRELKGLNSDIVWSGDSWTCGKQLKHYPTFCRSGTVIAIHAFVLIMAKEETHYVAYIEDMYEDRKGQKKVISAECVDGRATVLTPDHYDKFLTILPHASLERVYLCSRQFKSSKIKSFDPTKLKGYFEQAILSCLEEEEEFVKGKRTKMGSKRIRSSRGQQRVLTNSPGGKVSGQRSEPTSFGGAIQNLESGLSSNSRLLTAKSVGGPRSILLPFKIGEKIELLSNDSGIRGCWFRGMIVHASHQKQVKVQYDDLEDEDEPGNVCEWVPAFRLAPPDKLGMRCLERPRMRPWPPQDLLDIVFEIGAPVDAWCGDGWWEGALVETENAADGDVKVYFPGENKFMKIERKNLRRSRDWDGTKWRDIGPNADIHCAVAAALRDGTKIPACSIVAKGVESGGIAMSDRELPSASKLDEVKENKQDLDVSAGSSVIPGNMTGVIPNKLVQSNEKGKKRSDGDNEKSEMEVDEEKDIVDMKVEDAMDIDNGGHGEGCIGRKEENDTKGDGVNDKVDMKVDIVETASQKCDLVDLDGDDA
ncbi:uncharacterized protein LOC113288151 isoform X3 [Papaver somniferum]|uniref:uncharacterized protein LOC113288151 isoform X3 n=1 Tax=Papaver somniferum TaxID=3469 RepID=UPI000E702396|nr:uncharacterized protein LOC113288151 isoform X3 [Papaver somniferum]